MARQTGDPLRDRANTGTTVVELLPNRGFFVAALVGLLRKSTRRLTQPVPSLRECETFSARRRKSALLT